MTLFLFSDDSAWVRENFDSQGYPATVVDIAQHVNEPYHDLHLMSLCSHHIIANSSFSWWGAWLGRDDGITIAPEPWFEIAGGMHDTPAIAKWIKLGIH
jgi:hypothetical protein